MVNTFGGTIDLLAPQNAPESECLSLVTALGPVVRGNKLIERRGNVAIYQGPCPLAYEVVIIRIAEESVLGGKVVPRREVYPSAETWGTYGFTYSPNSHPDPLKAARAKMQQLTRARIKPTPDVAHRTKKEKPRRAENRICR